MTLKEQLADTKSALKALEENINAGEEEAIAQGEEIAAAIAEIEKSIESAEKANELLAQIGKEEEPEEDGMEKNEGLKALDLESLKGKRGTVSTYVKAASDPEVTTTYSATPRELSTEQLKQPQRIGSTFLTRQLPQHSRRLQHT